MKKFCCTVIVYILGILFIITIVNAIYLSKYDSDTYGTAKFENIPDGIEICNLGSSHGLHGYNYDVLGNKYRCFNFALNSQGLYYDAEILENYKEKLAPGCVVIVDISYFQFWGNSDISSDEFLASNKRYYRVLPPNRILSYDWYTDLIVNRIRCLDSTPYKMVETLFSGKRSSIVKSYPDIDAVVDVNTLQEDVYLSTRRHIVDDKRDANNQLIYNETEMFALEKIVKVCNENKFNVILVTVPYLNEYKDAIDEVDGDFEKQFNELIRDKSSEMGVNYYDYSSDERFCDDYTLFYNGDHLNSEGAKKFTNILYKEVIENYFK